MRRFGIVTYKNKIRIIKKLNISKGFIKCIYIFLGVDDKVQLENYFTHIYKIDKLIDATNKKRSRYISKIKKLNYPHTTLQF